MSVTTAMRYVAILRAVLLLTSMVAAYPRAGPPAQEVRLYFIAATSTWDRTDAFPANLYQIEKGKLQLVREVVPSSEGVEFIRHYDGVLTIGSPHIRPTRLFLVDARNGTPEISSVPLAYPDDYSSITSELFVDSPQGGLGLTLGFTSGGMTGHITESLDMVTLSSPLRGSSFIKNAPWSLWADLRVSGSTGGPLEQGDDVSCTFREGQVGCMSPVGLIRLLPVAPLHIRKGDDCTIAGSNQGFLIYIRMRSKEEAFAAKQKTFEIYNRSTHRTSEVEVQGSFSRVMLDDKWLIVTTVEPNVEHRPNPGVEGISEKDASALTPPIQELFAYNEPPQYFPGVCYLHDLESGAVFTLKTGQADTEILGVVNSTAIYRVNRQIILGDLKDSTVRNSRVIAEGNDVPAIHWLLKGR